jgi:hypothetical protein
LILGQARFPELTKLILNRKIRLSQDNDGLNANSSEQSAGMGRNLYQRFELNRWRECHSHAAMNLGKMVTDSSLVLAASLSRLLEM